MPEISKAKKKVTKKITISEYAAQLANLLGKRCRCDWQFDQVINIARQAPFGREALSVIDAIKFFSQLPLDRRNDMGRIINAARNKMFL